MPAQSFPSVGLDIPPRLGMDVKIKEVSGVKMDYTWLPFDAVGKIISIHNEGKACVVRYGCNSLCEFR